MPRSLRHAQGGKNYADLDELLELIDLPAGPPIEDDGEDRQTPNTPDAKTPAVQHVSFPDFDEPGKPTDEPEADDDAIEPEADDDVMFLSSVQDQDEDYRNTPAGNQGKTVCAASPLETKPRELMGVTCSPGKSQNTHYAQPFPPGEDNLIN